MGVAWLGFATFARGALVSYTETAVNDVDGAAISAVTASTRYLELNASYATSTAPTAWLSFRFAYWTHSAAVTALRDVWGRAVNPGQFVVLGASTATAHYLPTTRDADGDGVPDWFELEYLGTLERAAADDRDGDGLALAAEYSGSTNPLYGNAVGEGGVATVDSALVTCNLAGYANYTLRSVPAGTVNQSGVVPPGTVVTTANFSGTTTFGCWTLDGARQTDAWGMALTQLTFTVGTSDREAVANFFTGDTDADGVADAFEQRAYGTLVNGATFDGDGDGSTLLAEYTAGTNPLFGNSTGAGGVAWADSALITCNLAGYATYTLRSVPAGTVNQTATVPPGTVVTTTNFANTANFAFWTLDGVRQQDLWGVAVTQLTFTIASADREAVAYFLTGDSDGDGLPDAYEQRYGGTLAPGSTFDGDGDGVTLLGEYTAGTSPVFPNAALAGGVAWADSAALLLDLQADIAVEQPAGVALADGGAKDFGGVLVGQSSSLVFKIKNTGGRALSGLTITLDGANATEFSASTLPLSSLDHDAETTFSVQFLPVSAGAKSATLHLASNDPNENPFDVTLSGTALNNPPTISVPNEGSTPRNTAVTYEIAVEDVETSADALQVTAASSDQTVVRDAAIVVTGSGPTRLVTISPELDTAGSTRITLTVSDGTASTSASFNVWVIVIAPHSLGLMAVEDITSRSATLRGYIETAGFPVTAEFQYQVGNSPSVSVPAVLTPEGSLIPEASAAIEGLEPWTEYTYRFVARNTQGEWTTPFATFRTAGVAPEIVAQPISQSVTVGEAATFTVEATGVPAPSHQWWKYGRAVAGASEATLQFATTRPEDAGIYYVIVSNTAGSVTSHEVTLTVNRRAQVIAFASLPAVRVGDAPLELSASSSSGLPVSFASSNPSVATITGSTLTIVGAGTTTITASQSGDATYEPAEVVWCDLVVSPTTEPLTVFNDEFDGPGGSAPNTTLYECSGDVVLSGSGQLSFSTDRANTSWLRTRAGKAVGAGETLVVRFRAYAYAEDWNPGIYGDGQPRGLRVGTDANNAIEFYSVSKWIVGMRVRRDGVLASTTHELSSGVYAMNDYEIAVTASEAVFKVNGEVFGTISGQMPTGALNVFFSTFDGWAGNVPMVVERLSVAGSVTGFDLWRVTNFEPTELLDEHLSGPNASYAGDGVPNLVKYALGLDPKRSYPSGILGVGLSAGEWVATFTRKEGTSDVTCLVQVSTNLSDWSSGEVSLTRVASANGFEIWEARYPLSGNSRVFFRLKVTRP